mmetsp:Transcript_24515/g.61695  ORF Transcript_24515/g.61695 Transcript_24515/m.61695 type:complete len:344 (-) Transcript_24515:1388-2419(-)
MRASSRAGISSPVSGSNWNCSRCAGSPGAPAAAAAPPNSEKPAPRPATNTSTGVVFALIGISSAAGSGLGLLLQVSIGIVVVLLVSFFPTKVVLCNAGRSSSGVWLWLVFVVDSFFGVIAPPSPPAGSGKPTFSVASRGRVSCLCSSLSPTSGAPVMNFFVPCSIDTLDCKLLAGARTSITAPSDWALFSSPCSAAAVAPGPNIRDAVLIGGAPAVAAVSTPSNFGDILRCCSFGASSGNSEIEVALVPKRSSKPRSRGSFGSVRLLSDTAALRPPPPERSVFADSQLPARSAVAAIVDFAALGLELDGAAPACFWFTLLSACALAALLDHGFFFLGASTAPG